MKSICEMIDAGKNGERTYTVQISEGGNVRLSFDGTEADIYLSMTTHELKAFIGIAQKALDQRAKQLNEELQNV